MKGLHKKLVTFGLSMMIGLFTASPAVASDHDDGEMDLKGRSLNLTDLYAFREDWQNPQASSGNLILIMNSNPRALARQQYFFSTQARYEFHISRVAAANKAAAPKGQDDLILRFEFGSPDGVTQRQPIYLSLVRAVDYDRDGDRDGAVIVERRQIGTTTTLADMAKGPSGLIVGSDPRSRIQVFAGLREDPFYFDVERYFRVRGLLATGVNTLEGPTQGGANVFRSNATAVDFAAGYNVNSLVVRVPITLLQTAAKEPIFDVWETISVPVEEPSSCFILPRYFCNWFHRPYAHYRQIERLARPAINEGLVISNNLLNAFNSIPPSLDLSPMASPVIQQAASVLTAVHNYGTSAGLPAPAVSDVAAGFLPDVMRIDTRNQVPVGKWAYNSDAVIVNGTTKGAMLTGGRKIEDDVMDITLSYLIAGNPACGPGTACTIPDGVSYSGGTTCSNAGEGSNPSNPGHKCLFKQTERDGAAEFPFLAEAN